MQGDAVAGAAAPKGPIQKLEVVTYGESVERAVVGDGLTGDHIASYAAVRQNVENTLGRPLNKIEAAALRNNTYTVVIDDGLHGAGRTFLENNTRAQVEEDALDLNSAALKDQGVHLQNASQYGYGEADLQKAFDVLNQKNQALYSQISTKSGIIEFFKGLGIEVKP